MPRYNLRHDRELTRKDATFLIDQAEENRKAALTRGDVSTGKRSGTPTQQRLFFAEKLQSRIDEIQSGTLTIRGVTKKSVLERLENRKKGILAMNSPDSSSDTKRGNAIPGSGKGNLSQRKRAI